MCSAIEFGLQLSTEWSDWQLLIPEWRWYHKLLYSIICRFVWAVLFLEVHYRACCFTLSFVCVLCQFFGNRVSCFVFSVLFCSCLVVGTSAIDGCERPVPEMTCYVSNGTLNSTQSRKVSESPKLTRKLSISWVTRCTLSHYFESFRWRSMGTNQWKSILIRQ